jgi:arabinose-5-phosphate isomerase
MSVKTSYFLDSARRTLRIEREALAYLEERLDGSFERAVALLAECRGKVVVAGMGKSGLIGQKIAATLASTGTPSFFLHPAEGSHGDLGVLAAGDTVVLLSNSGETEEIVRLLPALKRLQVPLLAMTGNPQSTLAKYADVLLDVSVKEEACPLGLAPTASTTALLALGDALAVALLEHKGFTENDFAAVHPGGALGKRLLTRVRDLMHVDMPLTPETAPMRDALWLITAKHLGACGVVGPGGALVGIITDGDVRRALERDGQVLDLNVTKVMTPHPKSIGPDALAVEALNRMQQHSITCLFVCQDANIPVGIIHLHDLLRAGVV